MKKLIVALALVASAATVVLAVDKEKGGRKARKEAAKKEMKCCDKEMTKECRKESKACCEKKAKQ
ncbi:MAG: hypothetical protein ACK4YV_03535 [Emticicia sp.]